MHAQPAFKEGTQQLTRKTTVYTIAEKIAALEIATPEDVTTWAPGIIEAFRGTDLFYEFDTREGDMNRASGGRFCS